MLTASHASELFTPGAATRMPRFYGLTAAGFSTPFRGSVQRQIAETIESNDGPVDERELPTGQTLNTMIERGFVVECQAPADAEPIVPPVRLSEQRHALMWRVIHEWITGTSAEAFGGSQWTEHGRDLEGAAAEWFLGVTGEHAEAIGFCMHDSGLAGCSPDLWVPGQAGVELKCPAGWTHLEYLAAAKVPREYVLQIQFSLWVTGLPLWYFMSYGASPGDDSFLPQWKPGAYMQPLLLEVRPEERYQDAFSEHVPDFLNEMGRRARVPRGEAGRGGSTITKTTGGERVACDIQEAPEL